MRPAAPEARFRLGYRPALDGLRGVLMIIVMYVHGGIFWVGRGGFLSVDIFFVLSGCLITAILCEERQLAGRVDLRKFYARRALRLLPAFLAVIAACLIFVALFPPAEGTATVSRQILLALYLSDWFVVYPPLFHTWSLSLEEQFYIAWPLLLILMQRLRLRRRTMIALLAGAVAAVALNRAVLWYGAIGDARILIYKRFDTRADALLIGCVAGLLISSGAIPTGRRAVKLVRLLAALSAMAIGLLMLTVPSTLSLLYYGGFTLVAVMAAIFIFHLFVAPLRAFSALLNLAPLRWFGRLSYGMYLWHLPVYSLYNAVAPPVPVHSYTLRLLIPFAIKFALSVGVGALSFYFLEQPALRLKKRFASARAGAAERGALAASNDARPALGDARAGSARGVIPPAA